MVARENVNRITGDTMMSIMQEVAPDALIAALAHDHVRTMDCLNDAAASLKQIGKITEHSKA